MFYTNRMKILVVEDEVRIAEHIKKGLELERYIVDTAYDGREGYDLLTMGNYDVALIDYMLPIMNGVDIIKKVRKEGINIPIVLLTAKSSTQDKVIGLHAGADDYITKPFSFEELLARITAVSRRAEKPLQMQLTVGDIELNVQTHMVIKNHKEVTLSKKEIMLLEYLMRNKNITVSKEQLIDNVWSYDSDILPNTVEATIKNLRSKLDNGKVSYIKTVRGFGYMMTDK